MSKSAVAALEWSEDTDDGSAQAIQSAVEDVLRSLPGAQQQLLRARFGVGEDTRVVATIAAELGISDAQLRRLERRALRGLRKCAVLAAVAREHSTKIG